MTIIVARAATGSILVILLVALLGSGAYAQPTGEPAPMRAGAPVASQLVEPRTLDSLIAQLEAEAPKAGVKRETVRKVLAGLDREPEVLGLAGAQTEHERTVGQYVGMLVTPERIELGRARVTENAALLAGIEKRFGVDRHTLVALWGIESRYGTAQGTRPVIRALATLAMEEPRRPQFWRSELLQALRIVERGDIPAERMLGSWAGAMGHTQFMPSTFNRFAVDHDGDGRRDIWGSAADGLASAANYLAHSGWQRDETWGFEVALPAGFDLALSDPQTRRPLAFWRERGVVAAGQGAWPGSNIEHRLLLPAGANGPAFLVNRNFGALLRYNPAVSYGLAVAHLGDRLAGRGVLVAAWPDGPALSRADRQELQRLLAERGLETGGVDGIIGSLTRTAIRAYQKASSLAVDGHPSLELLERLRAGR
jgi:membrane-bound lytic murein transglycosylase B